MKINRSCKFQGCSLIYTGMVTDLDVPVLSVTVDTVVFQIQWRLVYPEQKTNKKNRGKMDIKSVTIKMSKIPLLRIKFSKIIFLCVVDGTRKCLFLNPMTLWIHPRSPHPPKNWNIFFWVIFIYITLVILEISRACNLSF